MSTSAVRETFLNVYVERRERVRNRGGCNVRGYLREGRNGSVTFALIRAIIRYRTTVSKLGQDSVQRG